MALIKALLLAGLVGVISAQLVARQPEEASFLPANYQFSYRVQDPETGDDKEQEETREGDSVRGFYTLVEADGSIRRVDYTADGEHGFQAVVSRQAGSGVPHPVQVARAAVVQPEVRVVAQPEVRVVRPVARRVVRPVTRVVQAAPVFQEPAQYAYVQAAVPQYVQAPVQTAVPQYVQARVATVPQYVTSRPVTTAHIVDGHYVY